MLLPNGEGAVIPADKLTKYLLAVNHPVGHSKAAYFRGLGYHDDNVSQLIGALAEVARTAEVSDTIDNEYGTKYVMRGKLRAPSGRTVWVRVVWIVDKGETAPRFVTAYPIGEQDQGNDS
jgi:Domain of unknown function (DUF6883)